jgi:hypothetical protein
MWLLGLSRHRLVTAHDALMVSSLADERWPRPPGRVGAPTQAADLMAWSVYKIAKKAVWLGIVEAPEAATAIEKPAAEFKVQPNRLMAIRR